MNSLTKYLLAFFLLLPLTACEDTNIWLLTDAATDAATAITLSDEDVMQLAAQAAIVADENNKVAPSSSPYHKRLQRLTKDHKTRDGHTFNYKVYLTNKVNAFAMADGTIRVYSGLMDIMSDDELLFIVGHEMGHVVKKHSKKQAIMAYTSKAIRKGLASQNNEVGQLAMSVVGAFTEQLTNAQFSQHEERQADIYGVRFLEDQGIEIHAAVSSLNKLADLAKNHTFLSSHPNPETRADRLLTDGLKDEESDEDKSLLVTILNFLKTVLLTLLSLCKYLINLLLSLL